MTHVALLGDSTFDNIAYVPFGEDVLSQLRQRVQNEVTATVLARDGARISDIPDQLARLPADVTHLVVSIGGNDALAATILLREKVQTIEDAVARLACIRHEFARDYESMLENTLRRSLRTALATIYEPRFDEPGMSASVAGGLPLFNDVITRLAFRHALPLLDLRLICGDADDCTSGIEPSAQGSRKIATTLARLLMGDNHGLVSIVYAS